MVYDFIIIGGGIVGLATAMPLQSEAPGSKLLLLEKETDFARHQTGHNSGVIHAGIYYQPGSLKAKLCKEGAEATKQFCRDHHIPFETCGKLLVATNEAEVYRMEALEERAVQNGIQFSRLSKAELRKVEPAIAGLGALHVPATGIVDYAQICRAMAIKIREQGGDIRLGTAVTAISETATQVSVVTPEERITARKLISCAGLQSDRVLRMAGLRPDFRIVPFRGEYFTLRPSKANIVRHLIYPIPDPDLPFLGIHLTRMIDGSITVGPNAVLGFAREGYEKGSVNFQDVADFARFSGFWKMAKSHIRSGIIEMRNSLSRRHYLEECRKYCPELTLADLGTPGAGIRAQAVMEDGSLVHDFLFRQSDHCLHVCNAPSPAATSSIPIGKMIVERLLNTA